jgi:cellobiose epimerase
MVESADHARAEPALDHPSPPFAQPERDRLSAELEADLRRHVIDVWFPRCVDGERGGFLCDFDRRWRPVGPQHRMLEFQARQTRVAAALSVAFPTDDRWPEIALHGFRFLRERMWDREYGGWFWVLDANGAPLHAATKHAHGAAYAVGACCSVFSATADPAALELALDGAEWIQQKHADEEHGGYDGWVTREGQKILSADAAGGLAEPLGGPLDEKNVNVHGDVAHAFSVLADVHRDAAVERRAAAAWDTVIRRFLLADGAVQYSFTRAWNVLPELERFGYPLQIGHRVLQARNLLLAAGHDPVALAGALVRHGVERGWREPGGIVYAGPARPPDAIEGEPVFLARRSWWVQAEGLHASLALSAALPSDGLLRQRFLDLHRFVRRELLDHRYGGWLPFSRHGEARRARFGRVLRRSPRKGGVWNDASHQTDMYLACLRTLRGVAPDAPL